MGMARTVAVVFGAVYVIAGLAGFVLETPLFSLFEISPLHNIAHLVLGAVLLYGATSTSAAIMTTRVVGAILVILGLLGFVDPLGETLPLGGNDIWLHLVTGAILLATGFMGESADAPRTA